MLLTSVHASTRLDPGGPITGGGEAGIQLEVAAAEMPPKSLSLLASLLPLRKFSFS